VFELVEEGREVNGRMSAHVTPPTNVCSLEG